RFIELKTVSMDLIKGLKDEIADLTQNIQDEWQNMQLHMGIFEGIVMKHCTLGIHAWWKIGFDSQYAKKGKSIDWEPGAGLAFFLAECNKVTTGFTILEGGIPEFEINKFVELFNTGLRDGVARLTKESHLPEAQERVTTLTDLSKELTKNVREVTKQLAGIKIIVDTKMLEAF
ncbi:MAG: hypothetical protein QGG83_04825, partial [Candidatus Woesearchaeota archaeon]|nr:hypothetical protein [Candidatus Woesearchaeota archaeon]